MGLWLIVDLICIFGFFTLISKIKASRGGPNGYQKFALFCYVPFFIAWSGLGMGWYLSMPEKNSCLYSEVGWIIGFCVFYSCFMVFLYFIMLIVVLVDAIMKLNRGNIMNRV
jgi:hypothetical protein